MKPKGGAYLLYKSHGNYDKIMDLLLHVADKGEAINLRTWETLDENGFAIIEYVVYNTTP